MANTEPNQMMRFLDILPFNHQKLEKVQVKNESDLLPVQASPSDLPAVLYHFPVGSTCEDHFWTGAFMSSMPNNQKIIG